MHNVILSDKTALKRAVKSFSWNRKGDILLSKIIPFCGGSVAVKASSFLANGEARRNFSDYIHPYESLCAIEWNGLGECLSASSRLKSAYFFLSTLYRESFIERHVGDYTVLFDDSVWQLVYGFAKREGLEEVPLPRAVLYFTASDDCVAERIQKRCESGRTNTAHMGLSSSDIRKESDKDARNAERKVEYFRSRGVPVFTIDLTEPDPYHDGMMDEIVMDLMTLNT